MKLIDSKLRKAEYTGGVQGLRDGNGLYPHVMPSSKYWRFDYRYLDKRCTLSLGVYPRVSLKQARLDLFAAKAQLADGIDPSYDKQIKKDISSDHTFKAITNDWQRIQNWTDSHCRTVELRIAKDLTPKLGHISVQKIQGADVLHVLRIIEARGSIKTAHRVKTIASQVLLYAVSEGLIPSDPCRDLRGALRTAGTVHVPAITDPIEFGKIAACR